jgi:hypothetical protein
MSIGLFGLITIGIALSICPALVYIYQSSVSSAPAKILLGIARLVQIVGFAALVASVVVFFLPLFLRSDLDSKTLIELNKLIESYHKYLEFSWVVFLLGIATLFGLAWVGKFEIESTNAKIAHNAIKAVSIVKLVVGILAACTFIGGDLNGRIQDRIADAEAEKAKINDVELALFSKLESVLAQDAVIESLIQASRSNSSVGQVQTAYHLVAPYLPSTLPANSTRDWAVRSRPEPDKVASDRSFQDVARVLGLIDNAAETQTGQDELVDDAVELVFDEQVVEPVKAHLLGLGNPILGALVDAFLDPLFLDAARQSVREKALDFVHNHANIDSTRDQLRASVQTIAAGVARRLPADAAWSWSRAKR